MSWRDEAKCRNSDWRMFFSRGPAAKAKAFCGDCPVKGPCLEDALSFSEDKDHGVRGGTTRAERLKIRRSA